MTFTSYSHDIFLSYARVDDTAFANGDCWVTTLKSQLEQRLSQLFGRSDAFSLWMDPKLTHYHEFGPEIRRHLERSATLLAVLSPGYLASPWCSDELETFSQLIKERDTTPGLFVVERDEVEFERRPPEIAKRLGYKFWERNGDVPQIFGHPRLDPAHERHYYDRLEKLARDLHEELKRLRAADQQPEPDEDRDKVFVAEVTDDLDEQRNLLCLYLQQRGYVVLPAERYPIEVDDFRAAVDHDVNQAAVFIQLLGGIPGKKLKGADSGCAALQSQSAVALNKPILQWREPALDLEHVRDADHQDLLRGPHVLAVDFDEFKRHCLERIEQELNPPTFTAAPGSVFINCVRTDRRNAQALANELDQRGYPTVLPIEDGKPSDVREDLNNKLLNCDGVIFFHDTSPDEWVAEQLFGWWKTCRQRKRPVRGLAVCYVPPNKPSGVGVTVPGLIDMEYRGGCAPQQLDRFLRAMESNLATAETHRVR